MAVKVNISEEPVAGKPHGGFCEGCLSSRIIRLSIGGNRCLLDKRFNALILTGFGLNCDNETAHVFELAGAKAHKIHINTLISGKVKLDDFQILALGGGFSWGDDHGGGVIQALKMKNHIGKDLLDFVEQGKLIIGICNGFQALVNLGLLPGIDNDYSKRSVSITYNDCGNFRDQWVHLAANQKSPCVFTKGIDMADFPHSPW